MIDKINAEADAIGCGKDEKIKALEALLKLAIQERDEALAAYEHVCNVALQCTAIVESADGCLGADLIEACNIGAHRPALTKLLTALKVKWNCPTVERGTNRYGLDVAYFRKLFNRELNRTLRDYRPDELARNLLRMARTADKSIIAEDEFTGRLKAEWQADVVDLAIDQLNKAGYTLTQPQSHAIELLRSLADSIRQQAHVTK